MYTTRAISFLMQQLCSLTLEPCNGNFVFNRMVARRYFDYANSRNEWKKQESQKCAQLK